MRKVFLLSALIALVFSSCQKQPKADFTMSKTECYVGESVTLTSTSTDASSYDWECDFQKMSTEKSFTYTPDSYDSYGSGAKFIALTVKSKNGKKTSYISKTLTIKNQNEAFKGYFTGNGSSGCELSSLYIDTDIDNQIKFDLGDGFVYAVVNSTKSATLISDNYYSIDANGSVLSITGGSVSVNGNTITLTVNFSYYDTTDNSTTSSSCTSVFTK